MHMMPAAQDTGYELSQRLRRLNLSNAKGILRGANQTSKEKDYNSTWRYTLEAPDDDIPLIAQLPPEILILVFEQGHEGRFTTFSHTVSSVCRYWRTLAVGTPSLWSPVVFAEDGHLDYLDRARLYLERSKSSPVDIAVNCGMGNLLTKFWNHIVPHLSHCRSLSIEGDGGALYADVEHLGSVDTPLLENLEITNTFPHLYSVPNTWSSPPPHPLFSPSNLQTLRMDMVQLHDIEATRYFWLGDVTNFWFRWEIPSEDHIDGGHEESTIDTHVSRIIEAMPKLRELTLTCWDTASDSSLVPLLDTLPPSLVFLNLSGISIAWDLKYGDWQRRDLSRLHTLKLSFSSTVNPVDTDLFALLGITPNLIDLYVGVVELLPHPTKSVRPLSLTHLDRLTLDWVGRRTVEMILQNLAAPALSKATFIVSHQFDLDDCRSEQVIPLFWKSCPRVESITLSHGCTLSRNEDLIAALRGVLRNVKHLDLRGHSKWDDELLRGLGTTPWPCPYLETVSFAYMPDLTQYTLESFLRARKRGFLASECTEIKRIGLRGCSRLRVTETLENIVDEVWHWI